MYLCGTGDNFLDSAASPIGPCTSPWPVAESLDEEIRKGRKEERKKMEMHRGKKEPQGGNS